jgi:hypothetical protein
MLSPDSEYYSIGPGVCDPYYARSPAVHTWLSNRYGSLELTITDYSALSELGHFRAFDPQDSLPTIVPLPTLTLTRHQCYSPAPWTSYPYGYRWDVASDQLGRCLSTEAWLIWKFWDGPPAPSGISLFRS